MIEDDSLPGNVKEKYVDLYYLRIRYCLTVYKRLTERPKGNRAPIRLSWAIELQELLYVMETVFTMSDTVGCKVYDGQITEFITRETIEQTFNSLFQGKTHVYKLFGHTKKNTAQKD